MSNNDTNEFNIDIHDRVAEAYYGKLGEKLQEETQKRIHWVRDHVVGNKILDIGCSQGIGPILLGRSGKQVIGVDISQKAVDEANEALVQEEDSVKENVTFKKADFLAYDAQKEKFDTITITEVLEHLENPEDFIDKAKDLLVNHGTLIVTVPFGINDHPDHKKTYYLFDLYQMLYKYFDIKEISILGKWIGFIALKRSNIIKKELESINVEHIQMMEKSFYTIERTFIERNNELLVKNDFIQKKFKEANSKYRDVLNEINQQKEDTQSASYRLGHLLIHETKSFSDIIRLPKRIMDIRKKKLNQ